ncbi:fructokinase [Shewanella gelidii]|uniref:Fructokinase n=1 Tax=Shewanella gelidii TaxID=1642821 RepID=A0A917JJE5_9GAMM|nr:fructokinase [Shewanella gelidii]MCL1096385.1 fructokinase [Shewanella gelidii]GGI67118.1 fructokinase [Shewanella gelidii]
MRFGVDLGGTKIELIALDEQGQEHYRKRIETPKSYHGTLEAITRLVAQAESHLSANKDIFENKNRRQTRVNNMIATPVGIGIPGAISKQTGLVKNANSVWLNGQNFQEDIELLLERPVRIANDANCFTVSEAIDGAGAGKPLVFGVILGTGCGAGIAINGRALLGPNRIAGEWGHNPLPWMRPQEIQSNLCFCGQYDCIETFISGTGFTAEYQKLSAQKLTTIEIMQLVQNEHYLACQAFNLYLDRLARALAHVINLLDPDVIVLGGGMSNIESIYSALPLILPQYVFGGECTTPILKNQFGDSSGVRGAAWLWSDAAKA